MKKLATRLVEDESGFILRGGFAVAFLVFLFVMALIGQFPWSSFFAMLLVSAVITGVSSLFNR